jgi:hypothetical protein
MITDVFLDQTRVNVCEHMVKTALHDSFGKVPPEQMQEVGRNGGKIECKSCEVNTRAVFTFTSSLSIYFLKFVKLEYYVL